MKTPARAGVLCQQIPTRTSKQASRARASLKSRDVQLTPDTLQIGQNSRWCPLHHVLLYGTHYRQEFALSSKSQISSRENLNII